MNKIKRDIINIMKFNKDGSPDKRFKKNNNIVFSDGKDGVGTDKTIKNIKKVNVVQTGEKQLSVDPNELHAKLLKDNNLKLDFDVLEGTIATKYGIIKLERPTLVIRANYVSSK